MTVSGCAPVIVVADGCSCVSEGWQQAVIALVVADVGVNE